MAKAPASEPPAPAPVGSGSGRLGRERVALIAPGGDRDRALAVLHEQEIGAETFDSVDDLLAAPDPSSLALYWAEPSLTASIIHTVEPLRRVLPDCEVVVICEQVGGGEVRRALTGGASGVVLADQLAEALGPCIRAVIAGQLCVPRPYSRQVEPAALSTRERQILGLVVMGLGNGQIAERLFLAESTVKSHLSSAFAKLDVGSRNEAVDLLLDPDRNVGRSVLGPVSDVDPPKGAA